jgi:methyl-accepting chemotaxis protein
MFKWVAKMTIAVKIAVMTMVILALFVAAFVVVVYININDMRQTLLDDTQAQFVETAQQIALTLDAGISSRSDLSDPVFMQRVIDRNMKARQATESQLIQEIRVHAPDPTSGVGYRAIAANSPDQIGQESDPEDIEAIKNDKLVTEAVTEGGETILDVTVPLHDADGQSVATAGIKLSMTQALANTIQLADQTTAQMVRMAVVVGLVVLGLGIVLSIVIGRTISAPLQQVISTSQQIGEVDLPALLNGMGAMAQGDLTRTLQLIVQPLKIQSQDEVGSMAQAFNAMITCLHETGTSFENMITKLNAVVAQMAKNAADIHATSDQLTASSKLAGQLTASITSTIQQIASGIAKQSENATLTASSFELMNNAIDGVAKGAQEQAAAVSKATVLTAQISNAVQQVARSAQASANSAVQAAQAAQSGTRTVQDTVTGMESIKKKVGISVLKVKEMGQRSDQIGVIVETIDDIASQTNLLALNAAIEAARAGEHGKGFAIVADEVRKLAERSSTATKEIGGLIKNVQQTATEAVAAMDDNAREVDIGVLHAGQAGDALANILSAVESVNDQVKDISGAAQEMSASSDELLSAMNTVSAVVEENTASTEEMAAISDDVTRAMEDIASISVQNSLAMKEMSNFSNEMSAQVEEVASSAASLNGMAQVLHKTVAHFKVNNSSLNAGLLSSNSSTNLASRPIDVEVSLISQH